MNAFLTSNEIVEKLSTASPVPCWTWNGYNEQQVIPVADRAALVAAVADEKAKSGFESAETIEDAEYVSVVIVNRQEFYGERFSQRVYTTRPGVIATDEDSSDFYDFIPQ